MLDVKGNGADVCTHAIIAMRLSPDAIGSLHETRELILEYELSLP